MCHIGTLSHLLVLGLLSIAEPLCPSRCLFGTILVTLCLMVWDWRVSRAEPMHSCGHDLLFLFVLLLFYFLLPLMDWLCGVEVFALIECSHSPGIAQRTPNNNIAFKVGQSCTVQYIVRPSDFFFVAAVLLSVFTAIFLHSFSLTVSYFIHAVPIRECLGKH